MTSGFYMEITAVAILTQILILCIAWLRYICLINSIKIALVVFLLYKNIAY